MISAFIVYHIHAIFLNMRTSKREWFIKNVYTAIGRIPFFVSEYDVEQETLIYDTFLTKTGGSAVHVEVRCISSSDWRALNVLVLRQSLHCS